MLSPLKAGLDIRLATRCQRIETVGCGQASRFRAGSWVGYRLAYSKDNVEIARILDVIGVTPAATVRCIQTTGVDDFAAVAQRATAAKRWAYKTQLLATQRDKATELNWFPTGPNLELEQHEQK